MEPSKQAREAYDEATAVDCLEGHTAAAIIIQQYGDKRVAEAESAAYLRAYNAVCGTNADMAKSAAQAYRLCCGAANQLRCGFETDQPFAAEQSKAALDKARADERAGVAAEVGRLTEVLRDIAGNGDPDFPSYSQSVARSALAGTPKDTNRCGPDYWSVALIAAWLREQDGHGEWRDAADAIDAEFLCRDVG